MKFKRTFFRAISGLFLWFVTIQSGLLQAQKIGGTVTAEDNSPLPGVNVFITGTTQGTITDAEGKYSINVSEPSASLTFSFVGYKQVIQPVSGRPIIDVQMEPETRVLDDVVVIGYGAVKKGDLTGSVSVVTQEDLTRTPIPNFSKAIQGKASGVVVYQSGAPGGSVNFRVRGIGSITQDPDPIFVIDGVVGGDINSFSPEDILSVSVLKDASAAAIYGANGANGVIIITTKRGANADKMHVSFSAYTGTNLLPKRYNLMNADEYAAFYKNAYETNNVALPPAYTDHFRQWYHEGDWKEGTDWQKEILQKNLSQNYYLNITDGNGKSNYSVSANYNNEEGILLNSWANRFNIRANSDFRIGKYVKIGESLSVTRKSWRNSSGSAWGMALESSPLMNVYNEQNKGGFEGTQIPVSYTDAGGNTSITANTGGNDKFNPRGILALEEDMNYSDGIRADVYLEIKPLNWITFTTTPSINASFNEQHNWVPEYDMGVRSVSNANLSQEFSKSSNYGLKNQLDLNRVLGKQTITFTAVQDVRYGSYRNSNVSATGFPYEQLNVISQSLPDGRVATGGEGEWSELAYLARVIYNYDSKYLVTASIRRDGSSNFGPKNKFGNFPSFSFAWKVNEDLLQDVDQINMLKLRFGWGQTGNSNIGGFRYQTTLAEPIHFSPVFGKDQKEVYALNELWTAGNPYVKWEAADMLNFGFDLNAFRNRFQMSAEYYIKTQYDLLLAVPISRIHGKWDGTSPIMNIGDNRNKGFEFDLRYNKMEGSFNYKLFANLNTVKNEVIRIPSDIEDDENITSQGHTIGSLYGFVAERIIQETDFDESGKYKYALPAEGEPKPGDLMFRDLNSDGVINDQDRTIIGKAVPDFTYSFGAELYYRNFDFSVFLYGIQNADIYNTLRRDIECVEAQDLDHNKSADWAQNYWTPENKSTKYLRPGQNDTNKNTRLSSWWVEDASFLRLKDIQMGYTLPRRVVEKSGLSKARLYISAMNLYTFTRYVGYDPESPLESDDPRTPGVDANAYPIPRNFTAGIQIDF